MAVQLALDIPQRPRKYRFALTPLADAMFQLLIFFMLSSNLTQYSLLTLQSGAAPPPETAAAATTDAPDAAPEPPAPADTRLWTLEAGTLTIGGQAFSLDGVPALAASLAQEGEPVQVILILRPSALVQDVTDVLQVLQGLPLVSVQITGGGG